MGALVLASKPEIKLKGTHKYAIRSTKRIKSIFLFTTTNSNGPKKNNNWIINFKLEITKKNNLNA